MQFMKYGILKDIKEGEFRVISTPAEVRSIVAAGHTVWAQHDCGKAAGFPDEAYEAAGARIVATAEEMWAGCDMVAKVKEFTPVEYPLMRKGQIILGCIHPAGHPEEVEAITGATITSRAICTGVNAALDCVAGLG